MCDKMKIVQGLCDYVLLTVKIAQELETINSMYKSTYKSHVTIVPSDFFWMTKRGECKNARVKRRVK